MHAYHGRKAKTVWKRRKSDLTSPIYLNSESDPDLSFLELKSATKKASIMSRLQVKKGVSAPGSSFKNPNPRAPKNNYLSNNPTKQSIEPQRCRPATSQPANRISSMKMAKRAYEQEKKINQHIISENTASQPDQAAGIKEGLLGQYERYSSMSKQELIEKLISLQYLANGIFRKNKQLEEKVRQLSIAATATNWHQQLDTQNQFSK